MSKSTYDMVKTTVIGHEPGTDIITITIHCANVKSADDLQAQFVEMVENGEVIQFFIHPPGKEGNA